MMIDSGSRNYLQAKRKAAEHVGVSDARYLPRNQEIEQALSEYQRLFRADTQPHHLQRLRRTAAQAMQFLAPFAPRLVGPVLEGTADRHSEVNLHLFADGPEEVGHFLAERGIPAELTERRLRLANDQYALRPEYRFLADEVPVALTVFSGPSARQPPLSPVDGRPMRRAGVHDVEALLTGAS